MSREGASYEIRVKGRLSDSLMAAFEGMQASVEPVETVIHGPVRTRRPCTGCSTASRPSAWSCSRSGGSRTRRRTRSEPDPAR